jgi:hypothetical protein
MDVEDYFRSLTFKLHQLLEDGMIGYLDIEYRNGAMHFDVEEDLSHIPITAYMDIPDTDEVAEEEICVYLNLAELNRAKQSLNSIKAKLKELPGSINFQNKKTYYENVIGEYSSWFEKHDLDDGITVIKINKTDALWSIADDLGEKVKLGDFPSKRDAYRWWCKHHTHKGKDVIWESLENEYHKAKSAGRLD